MQGSEQNSFSSRPLKDPQFSFHFCLRNKVSTALSSSLKVRWHSWYQTAKHASERRETNMAQELNDFKCLFPRKMHNLSSDTGLALAELTAPSEFNPNGWCSTARTRKVVHLCVMELTLGRGMLTFLWTWLKGCQRMKHCRCYELSLKKKKKKRLLCVCWQGEEHKPRQGDHVAWSSNHSPVTRHHSVNL